MAINLVPSETRLSPLASLPLATDFYNRYFFNTQIDPSAWDFRGAEPVGKLESDWAVEPIRSMLSCAYVSVRPTSGMNAMLLSISALTKHGEGAVVSISPDSGGHYATGALVRRLGLTHISVGLASGRVDPNELDSILSSNSVQLIYLDLQNSLTMLDVRAVIEVVNANDASIKVHVDCSHVLGFVLGGLANNPLDEGALSVSGSTHKSFPGPQKGIIATRSTAMAQAVMDAEFNLLSSHHFAETLSLGLAATEFMRFGSEYVRHMQSNARLLWLRLKNAGFDVVLGSESGTDTHQVWVRMGSGVAERVSDALAAVGIRVNTQSFLPRVEGTAIRFGTNEITLEGAGSDSIEAIVAALIAARDGKTLSSTTALEVRGTFNSPYWYDTSGL